MPKKFLMVLITLFAVNLTLVFAKGQEGIFIEAISEINGGNLTINELRTRPTEISDAVKKIPVEADGYYISDDDLKESIYVAQDRAKIDAKRALSEQISIHIKSISEMKNGKLTRDEIHTLSVIVMQIESETVTTKNLEGSAIQYQCHIKAFIDDSNIFKQLDYVGRENFRETVRRTIEIEKETARLNAELNSLKKKIATASEVERAAINARVQINEKNFTAIMWNEQAYIANYQGNFDKAVEYCYKVIEINPTLSEVWNNLGYAYNFKGNFDKALECYNRAIELNQNDSTPYINIGGLYDSMKYYDKAAEYYEKALKISPDNADALNGLGYVYIQQNNFDKGIEYCQKAVEIDSKHAAAWNGLGYSYNQKKKFYKAVECCRKAVGLNKNYANAWNNLGFACAKINRLEDSYTAYRNAVKLSPKIQLYITNLDIAKKRLYSFKSL